MKKIFAVFIVATLVMGLVSFAPTIEAKTTYKTLAFDKKLAAKDDFAGGTFKNTKLEENSGGIEIGAPEGGSGEYITPIEQAPFGATHIGLHWKENIAEDPSLAVYLRTSSDGENFTEWTKVNVEPEEGKNGETPEETFASLEGAGKAAYAQAKIEFTPENGISPKLKTFTLTFLNSGEESAKISKKFSLTPESTAAETGTVKTLPDGRTISVISREEWGADESLRLTSKGTENWPRSWHGTRKIIVHHTGDSVSNGVTDLASNEATMRATYYYHAVTKGWGDIGYNALVDAAGNIYEGRYGTHGTSLTRTNPSPDDIMVPDVEAAHAASYNSGSFGVSAMGDFTSFDIPAAQLAGMENVMAYIADARGINTQGVTDFLRYDGTWHMKLNNVVAHRDVGATACPGDRLYSLVTTIKTDVDHLMLPNISGFSATLNGKSISGTSVGLGTLNFSWSSYPNAASYQYVLERVYGVTGSATNFEPWQVAWLDSQNTNVKTTTATSVQVDSATLKASSNYVFYVRALDANGQPLSTVSHVNFKRNSTTSGGKKGR